MTRTTKLFIFGGVIAFIYGVMLVPYLSPCGISAPQLLRDYFYLFRSLLSVLFPLSFICGIYYYRAKQKDLLFFCAAWLLLLCFAIGFPEFVTYGISCGLSGTIEVSNLPPFIAPEQYLVGSTSTSSLMR